MDTYTQKWTILQERIFSLLCLRAGEKLSQRDIAKILKVSPTAITNSIPFLLQTKLISLEKTKTIHFLSFHREEQRAIELKRIENLKFIYLSGLSDYLERELAGATVILFGSYSRGEDTKNSDIDLAVIERKEKRLSPEKYELILQRRIHILFYSSWKDIPKELKNNILNGILLHGSVCL